MKLALADTATRVGAPMHAQRVLRVVPDPEPEVEVLPPSSHEPQPSPRDQFDTLFTMTGTDPLDPLSKMIAALDTTKDSTKCLLSSLKLMRRMQNKLLTEQEQPRQFACFKHSALAVLAPDDERDLERSPLSICSFPECVLQHIGLPRIQPQPHRPS